MQLRDYLSESYKDAAFLEAEHKRRGDLMKVFDGVRVDDLDNMGWMSPDWCNEGDRWWPCQKPPK